MIRPVRRVFVSSMFEKKFSRLPRRIQRFAMRKDSLFRRNAFHPSLETHQLAGELKGDWAYSVNKSGTFLFIDARSVMYVNIGTHGIYK